MMNRFQSIPSGVVLSLIVMLVAVGFRGSTLRGQEKSKKSTEAKREAAHQKESSLLTLERIFDSSHFRSQGFSKRWDDERNAFLSLESSERTPGGRDIVLTDAVTEEKEILVPAEDLIPGDERKPLSIERYTFSEDRSRLLIYTNARRVWRTHSRGDYWVLDRTSRSLRKLGGPDAKPSTLMFAKFSPDGRKVAYVRKKNIYCEDLVTGRIVPLTQRETPHIINGTFDWVYEEEFRLRDGFRWSPDSRSIAYWQLDTEGVPTFTMIDNLSNFYPETITFAHPKTGMTNSAARIGVVSVEETTGKKVPPTHWVPIPGDPRENYLARMQWAPVVDGKQELWILQLNRLQNRCRLYLTDPLAETPRRLFEEKNDSWLTVYDPYLWSADGRKFTWISERDGWRHVYEVDRETGKQRVLTPGEYDILELLHWQPEKKQLYVTASPEEATRQYLYRVEIPGGNLHRVTPKELQGTNGYRFSPDASLAVTTHSTMDRPPVVRLVSLPDHETIRMLAENKKLKDTLAEVTQEPVEFFQVPTGEKWDDGSPVVLDGWCIRPPDFDPKKRYPVLIYVYGEPAGTTVRDRWPGSTGLWHKMLAQQGYFVMSFDNRGTPAPKGRKWRKCIYRKVGIIAPRDQAGALREVLKRRPYLDPERTAIWGWSGGGSMSLNAIFKYPDLYHAAMAVAPVPNQRAYDTIYQERYMGLPSENVEGYREGSPITYAHQLQGDLLVVHGTGDDNCHYATVEKLFDELIRHGKQFTMMSYPNRTHSIRERAGTTMHLRTLLTNYLQDHVPPGGRPPAAEKTPATEAKPSNPQKKKKEAKHGSE